MSSRAAKTLLNKILKKSKYNNVIKYEEICTKIYIFSINMDDDKLIKDSIINQFDSSNQKNDNDNNDKCCKFNCCKLMNN